MAPITGNFNQDELNAPDWMNADFFTKVLHSCEKDNAIRVKDVQMSPATLQGDHYASIMFRAKVDYETRSGARNISMIIKTMPEVDGNKKGMLQDSFIFETEIAIYTKVIPKFEAMLRQKGDKTKMGARCLYHSLSPRKLIIFEDIVPLGFETLRDRPANTDETKLALSKLAKWHALSYVVNQENPVFFDEFTHSLMELSTGSMASFLQTGISFFVETLATRPTLAQYKSYFEALQPRLIENCLLMMNEYRTHPQKDEYYVLCHGDFHVKNMMFKYSGTRSAEDVVLLDFQISYVGSIVNDLIYAKFMLMDKEKRTLHYDELLHYYFCCFTETLQLLDYAGPKPKMLQLRQALLKHKDFELLLIAAFLPVWHGMDNNTDVELLVHCSEFRKSLYSNENFLQELEECLPKLLQLGYLDS